ncbi:MAG TPA: hypothetical protein V6D28_27820 [Leptolyngbyaceae cyanobacterium]
MTINFRKSWINNDTLANPVCDRLLPNHPWNIMGTLPHWYTRMSFPQYGLPDFDLPLRGLRRSAPVNEANWHRVTRYRGRMMWRQYWPIGALLPAHRLFRTAYSPEVVGNKIDPTQPWAFRYID